MVESAAEGDVEVEAETLPEKEDRGRLPNVGAVKGFM